MTSRRPPIRWWQFWRPTKEDWDDIDRRVNEITRARCPEPEGHKDHRVNELGLCYVWDVAAWRWVVAR